MSTEENVILSSAEAAELLGIGEGTLRQWRLRDMGPEYYKVGRKVRYDRSAVLEWLRARRRRAGRGPA